MGFPDKKEIARAKEKMESVDPVRLLSSDASKVEKLKFELCKQFVVYLRVNKMSQMELADKLAIEPDLLNDIVKYRVELFTLDRLLEYLEKLNPDFEVTVA